LSNRSLGLLEERGEGVVQRTLVLRKLCVCLDGVHQATVTADHGHDPVDELASDVLGISLHLLVHSYAHEQQDDVLALDNWGSVPPLAFELVHIDFELGIQLQEAFDGLARVGGIQKHGNKVVERDHLLAIREGNAFDRFGKTHFFRCLRPAIAFMVCWLHFRQQTYHSGKSARKAYKRLLLEYVLYLLSLIPIRAEDSRLRLSVKQKQRMILSGC
jgi:hypothetical protein